MERFDRIQSLDRPRDNRTDSQRDRDRILFTTAFRRLAGVTQVVGPEEGHIFHNRLTHSLEVAQVGRRVCEKLLNETSGLAALIGGLDPDVVEAACLAHDLGHPPFGHIAEETLDELARHEGDLPDGFEGNPQSFRIVTKLAYRSSQVVGLNLTRATLNAMLKYPWLRGTAGKKNRKWGAYHSEESEFKFARANSSVPDKKSPEASIMDWADDITYSVHDLEDFYRARLIPLHILVSDKNERLRFFSATEKRLETDEAIGSDEFARLEETFDRFLDTVPIDSAYHGTQAQRTALRSFTAGLIGRYVKDTRLKETDDKRAAIFVPAGYKREVKMLKQLTWHYVIDNPALATQQYGQRSVIKQLFHTFLEIGSGTTHRHVLPAITREQVEQLDSLALNNKDRKRELTRIVVDAIAGMTERHVLELHRRLTGTAMGSALDYLGR